MMPPSRPLTMRRLRRQRNGTSAAEAHFPTDSILLVLHESVIAKAANAYGRLVGYARLLRLFFVSLSDDLFILDFSTWMSRRQSHRFGIARHIRRVNRPGRQRRTGGKWLKRSCDFIRQGVRQYVATHRRIDPWCMCSSSRCWIVRRIRDFRAFQA